VDRKLQKISKIIIIIMLQLEWWHYNSPRVVRIVSETAQ